MDDLDRYLEQSGVKRKRIEDVSGSVFSIDLFPDGDVVLNDLDDDIALIPARLLAEVLRFIVEEGSK